MDQAGARTAALRLRRSAQHRAAAYLAYSSKTSRTRRATCSLRNDVRLPKQTNLSRRVSLASNQFAQPFPVMTPCPSPGHLTARHGANRATYPNRRINMHNPDTNDNDCSQCMDKHRNTLLVYRRILREILVP